MSDLDLGPAPSSSPARAFIAAAVILLLAAAGVFYYFSLQKAELTVTQAKPFAIRIENKGTKGTSNIIGAPPSIENDLFIVLTVKLTNHFHEPMFIKDETFAFTVADGSVAEASALQKAELESTYGIFPALKAMSGPALFRDTKIEPGATAEGTVILSFPNAAEKDWATRKAATLKLSFFHHPDMTAPVR